MTRVAVVLGAGGITGIAWLLGALEAIRQQTGWDPATADVLTGTSAGAVAATVTAGDVHPERLLEMAERPEVLAAAIAAATECRATPSSRRPPWPASLPLVLSGLVAATPRARATALTGLLPRGLRSGDEIRGLTHAAVAKGWPDGPKLLLHASDLRTGRRVIFGADGGPEASLADAVVASCAVPGYYQPARIGGRDYVDGGLHSFTNAGAVARLECDVVLCLAPFSSSERGSLLDTTVFGAARRATAWQLGREAAALRAMGASVAVVEPADRELRAMGLNVMDRGRSRRVFETAVADVGARLDRLLAGVELPSGGADAAPAALAAAA